MSKSISISLAVVWGILALIIGAGIVHSHITIARAQTEEDAPARDTLLASAYANQGLDALEKELEYEQALEEFDPQYPVVERSPKDNDLVNALSLPESPQKQSRTITTPLIFKRGDCPRPEALMVPPYALHVSKENGVYDFVPSFLVDITGILPTKNGRSICLDETTALHLADLFTAAGDAGYSMTITSGYRSRATQSVLMDRAIERHGHNVASTRVAPPGHSEHQLGTTIDLAAATNGYISAGAAFGYSPEYAWMLENAANFGFSLSYPDGHQDTTGYIFEPWHWRFVGVENIDDFSIVMRN